jgi:hypothetical protein
MTAQAEQKSSEARIVSGLNALRVIDRPRSTASDVAEALEVDPELSERLLRMARSPLYGVVDDELSVGRAVVLLGFLSVRKAVVVHFCRSLAAGGSADGDRWTQALWRAIAAEQLAVRLAPELAADAFMAGIMRSFSSDVTATGMSAAGPVDDPDVRARLDSLTEAGDALAELIIAALPALPTTTDIDRCLTSVGLGRLEDGRLAVDVRRGFDLYDSLFT